MEGPMSQVGPIPSECPHCGERVDGVYDPAVFPLVEVDEMEINDAEDVIDALTYNFALIPCGHSVDTRELSEVSLAKQSTPTVNRVY